MGRFGNVIITSDILVPFDSSNASVFFLQTEQFQVWKEYDIFYLQRPVEITLGKKNKL